MSRFALQGMGKSIVVGLLVLELILVSCSPVPAAPNQTSSPTQISQKPTPDPLLPSQSLPITAQVKIGRQQI